MNLSYPKPLFIIGAFFFLLMGGVQAQYLELITADDPIPIAASQAPGVWYVDRYAPSAFEMDVFSSENVIRHSIDGIGDGAANRGSQNGTFYNTQGRKYDLGTRATTIHADIYIPADFETNHRRAGLWGTAEDENSVITSYPILSFRNVDGMSPTFSYYSSSLADWVDLSTTITYDEWYSFEIMLDLVNEEILYYINGTLVGTDGDSFGSSVQFQNMILQAYNFNDPVLPPENQSTDSYDVYWDNVGSSSTIHNVTQDTYHPTIQDAINNATTGDMIEVGGGTYVQTSTLNINKGVTIQGDGSGTTTIDMTALSGTTAYGITTTADDITFSGFTLVHPADPGPDKNGFTLKAGDTSADPLNSNLTLSDLVIDGAERTPFDFNGVDMITVTDLQADNTTGGNGMQFTGCTDVTVNSFSGTNNAWGSIAIYASDDTTPERASDNVTIDGAGLSIDGAIYSQDRIDGMNDLFNTNISVTGWDYKVFNDDFRTQGDGHEYTFFVDIESNATLLAEQLNLGNGGNTASAIQQVSSGEWFVTNPNLSIQAAIDEAETGDVINVEAGTYVQSTTLNINKGVTLEGDGSGSSTIDMTALSGTPSWGIRTTADDITFSGFTLVHPADPGPNTNGFTLKAGDTSADPLNSNLTVSDLVIDGAERTPFDFNGVDMITVTDLQADNTTGGNGMQFTGCTDVTVNSFTGTNNAWGSIAIYASDDTNPERASDNVTIDGAGLSIDGAIYSQDRIDGMNDLFNTNISVTGWDYKVFNDDFRTQGDGHEYTFFVDIESNATLLAEQLNLGNGGNTASAIQQVSSGEWFVTNPNLSIQAAIDEAASGDIVNVYEGEYQESLDFEKSLSLLGPNATESPNTGTRSAEAILKPQDETALEGLAADVTVEIKGFTVDMEDTGELGAFDSPNRFFNQTNKGNTTWTFEHNIFQNGYFVSSGNWRFNGAGNAGLLFNLWDNFFTNNEVSNGIAVWGANPSTISVMDNVWEDNGYTAMNINHGQGIISNNTFRDTRVIDPDDPDFYFGDYQAGILLANDNYDLDITNNTFDNVYLGISLYESVDGIVNITDNTFDGTVLTSIIASSQQEGGDLDEVTIQDNSFLNYAGEGQNVWNARDDNQVLDASLNYWGSSSPDFGNLVTDLVTVCPFYTDAGLTMTAETVTNTTQMTTYCSIQEAIDAADPGDEIEVLSGTYDETITIDKWLTLSGANADTDCDSRGGESTIAPSSGSGAVVTITASNVTLNGFEITGPGNRYGINVVDVSNTDIKYNNINHIGTDYSGGNVYGIISIIPNTTTIGDLFINNNCIDAINTMENTGFSAGGIGILQSTTTGTLAGLEINDNSISNVVSNTAPWPEGKIAYGVIINVGGNSNFETNGKVLNANITGNTISDLEGFIATGIGLEGNTENAYLTENVVTGLTGYKSADRAGGGYDLNGLKFENNRYVGTITVEYNSFDVSTFEHDGTPELGYAIANYVDASISGAAMATCNWLGSAVGSEIYDNPDLDGKIFAKTDAEIVYDPWLATDDLVNPDCSGMCDPSKPTNVVASNATSSTIDLDWDDVGAPEYEVYNSANFQTVTTNTNSITLTGLPSGTTFNVAVRAKCGNGDVSNWTFLNGVSTAEGCVAVVPTNVAASNATSSTIDLDWDDVGADSYEVYNSANFQIATTNTNSITLTGLPSGTTFNVAVRSKCNDGDVSAWVFLNGLMTEDGCVVTEPTNLSWSNPTSSTVDIAWDDVNADTYEVYNSANFQIATTNTNSITLTGLPSGATFNVGVRSKCNGDVSEWVFINGVMTTEGCIAVKPTNLMASNATSSTIDLDWDDMDADEYEVYNSANFQFVTTNTNSITLTGLPASTVFNVAVRSKCANGDVSAWTFLNGVATTAGCVAQKPTNVVASNATSSTVDLDWDDMGADSYEVYNSANFQIATTNTNSITLTGLPSGTTFNVGVRSKCANGDISAWKFLNGVSTASDRPIAARGLDEGNMPAVTADQVKVFPNPVTGNYVNVQLDDAQVMERISLYSLTGELIQWVDGLADQQYELNFNTTLPAGTYLLRIEGADFAVAKRIVVQ
jgi:TusA-related sulfurtransferase